METIVSDDLWVWGDKAEKPRMLHSMVRVSDLDKSLHFYCDLLGMKQLSRFDVEQGRFSIVFLSFSGDHEQGAIELTHNWDADENEAGYSHGSGYGHIAIGFPDIPGTCERLEAAGVEVTVKPKILFEGGPSLAFVKDPDGYAIELIQTSKAHSGV